MNITELLQAYGPQAIEYILTGALIFIVGKFRAVSDKNLLDVFNNVKTQAKQISVKNNSTGS